MMIHKNYWCVTHGGWGTRLYKIWEGMKARCNNPNDTGYCNYGGKGVAVCDEWNNDFLLFKNWAELNEYENDLTIDRINPYGNYEPLNCRWATASQQQKNKRKLSTNTSGYIGVSYHKHTKKWRFILDIGNKQIYKSGFDDKKTAAIARNIYINTHNTGHSKNFT